MVSLQTFLREKRTSTHDTVKGMSTGVVALEIWRSNMFDGQWFDGLIPKLTTFSYWNRKWDVRISNFPFMDWCLFALQSTKKGEELFPFVGP